MDGFEIPNGFQLKLHDAFEIETFYQKVRGPMGSIFGIVFTLVNAAPALQPAEADWSEPLTTQTEQVSQEKQNANQNDQNQ